jgi:hypothetical protein
MAKRKTPVMFKGDQIYLFISKSCNYLPWKMTDAVETPQWKTFVANAIAKNPLDRTSDETRAITIELARNRNT